MRKTFDVVLNLMPVILALASQPIHATQLAYEGFTPSFPVYANGGTGFNGPWTGTPGYGSFVPLDGSLCYLRFPSSAGSITASPSNPQPAFAVAQRLLAQSIGADNTTVYISFLIQPTGPFSNQDEYFGISLNGLFIGKPGMGASTQYVIENYGGGGQVPSGKQVAPRRTTLLVVKAQFLPGDDQFTLYVDPMPGQPEPATGVTKSDLDVGTVLSIIVVSAMFTSGVTLDEIRIGTTYADVVPNIPFPASIFACLADN